MLKLDGPSFLEASLIVCLVCESSFTLCLNYQLNSSYLEAELKLEAEAEAEAFCWQPAGTLTSGTGPSGTHGRIFVQCQDL
jgi:hypothetical protein